MMIAFIGCGGAGGNIANEAAKQGFEAGAINFSQKDLDALDKVKFKLRIRGSEGVGHNREVAISLIQEDLETVINFFKENFSHPYIEVIIVAFSSSGGSGSGISPILIELISNLFPQKIIVAMPIIPDIEEVTINQINTLATFEDLSKLNICIRPIDNQQVKNKDAALPKNKLYAITNNRAVSEFSKILSYTEKHSINGNFDKRDLATILDTKGIANISITNIVGSGINGGIQINLTRDGITKTIHDSWKDSLTPIEFHQVTRAGIIYDTPESWMEYLDYNLIFSRFNNGMPLDLFEGNYHYSKGEIVTILSGLSWINERLSLIEKLIEDNKEKIELIMDHTSNQNYKAKNIDVLTKIRKPQVNPVTRKSVSDILNKYRR